MCFVAIHSLFHTCFLFHTTVKLFTPHLHIGCQADIRAWFPKVKRGGTLFFDDVSYQYPGVGKALDEFVDINHLTVHQMNKYNNYYVKLPS